MTGADWERKVRKELAARKKGAVIALRLSAALVKRKSQSQTPVDEGNLEASHYTAVQVGPLKAVAEIGLTSEYAIYVHENVEMAWAGLPRIGKDAKGVYWASGRAKFLEDAMRTSHGDILKLFKKHAK